MQDGGSVGRRGEVGQGAEPLAVFHRLRQNPPTAVLAVPEAMTTAALGSMSDLPHCEQTSIVDRFSRSSMAISPPTRRTKNHRTLAAEAQYGTACNGAAPRRR